MNRRCAVFAPAYAHCSPPERQRARDAAQRMATANHWQLLWLPSSQASVEPGQWLDIEQRWQELQDHWDVDYLWALRGGYGCVHLLPQLLACAATRAPTLIGYSDLSVLHALWQRRSWGPSFYAAMPALSAGQRAWSTLQACLSGSSLCYADAELPQVRVLYPGRAEGACFAACVSVLCALIGTPAMPDLRGCILLLEDIDERPYRMDRMLWQLSLAGCLHGLRGLVFGRLPYEDMAPRRGPEMATILGQWAQRLALPMLCGLPFGHEDDPLAIPCGRQVTLQASAGGSWKLAFRGSAIEGENLEAGSNTQR